MENNRARKIIRSFCINLLIIMTTFVVMELFISFATLLTWVVAIGAAILSVYTLNNKKEKMIDKIAETLGYIIAGLIALAVGLGAIGIFTYLLNVIKYLWIG